MNYLPLLTLDRRSAIPVVHADDVAAALVRVLDRGIGGASNLSTDQPLTREIPADGLGTRALQMPAPILRAAVSASWQLHLQPLSPGWIDLAFATPSACAPGLLGADHG